MNDLTVTGALLQAYFAGLFLMTLWLLHSIIGGLAGALSKRNTREQKNEHWKFTAFVVVFDLAWPVSVPYLLYRKAKRKNDK